jgi:hypothetical protein
MEVLSGSEKQRISASDVMLSRWLVAAVTSLDGSCIYPNLEQHCKM